VIAQYLHVPVALVRAERAKLPKRNLRGKVASGVTEGTYGVQDQLMARAAGASSDALQNACWALYRRMVQRLRLSDEYEAMAICGMQP
jgi:hypothetical protein